MPYLARSFVLRICALLLAAGLAAAHSPAFAQDSRQRFDQQALDVMLAPIALYPDQLLTQVLMAATYPQEVEEAARWSRSRSGLSGDAAVRTAEGWDWDPSVRSLTAFPQVLDTMGQHMAWTEDLGTAFIVQPEEVMDTVQRLRFRAYDAGTLRTSESTRVIHTGSSIIIESVSPQVVYVPYYDTRVVYGPWWWPARPPMYWPRWHGYYAHPARPSVVYWGPGTWVSAGFFFGGFDWPRREVRVINTRTYYYAPRVRQVETHRPAYAHPAPPATAPHVWRHDDVRRSAWRQQAQPTERAIQRQPGQVQPRQETPSTGAPRYARPQSDDDETGAERRERRRREENEESGRRSAGRPASVQPSANPQGQPSAPARAPRSSAGSPVAPAAPSPVFERAPISVAPPAQSPLFERSAPREAQDTSRRQQERQSRRAGRDSVD